VSLKWMETGLLTRAPGVGVAQEEPE
jgi:hypothetical protein